MGRNYTKHKRTERTEMLGGNSAVNITGANFNPVSLSTRTQSILKDNNGGGRRNTSFLAKYKNLKHRKDNDQILPYMQTLLLNLYMTYFMFLLHLHFTENMSV
jgi:hypothetical protein